MTDAEIADGIAALLRALASASLSVQFSDGRRVQYRSVAEIRAALAELRAEQERRAAGSVPVIRSSLASWRRA
ncbi:MAG: hypothetical protein N2688_00235 [Burkholderiaceae bacterium]|nr:hypothetical protein [Burkholderiaceae bacterium]